MTQLSLHTSDFCVAPVHGHGQLACNNTKNESLYSMRHAKLLTNSRIDCFDDGLEHILFGMHGQSIAETLPPVRAEQGTSSRQMKCACVIGGGNLTKQGTCRVALHLQIASTQSLPQEQQQHSRAPVTALPAAVGAVDSIQTRQSSAERDLLAQEQEHSNREGSATGPAVTETAAAAAEAAVLASCEVAQQVLQQLQCLEASTVAGLMVHNIPCCIYNISDCSQLLLLYILTVQQLLAGPLLLQS